MCGYDCDKIISTAGHARSVVMVYTSNIWAGSVRPDPSDPDANRMTKGLLTTLAVMLVCTIIPVAQVLLAPFGPFLGAYFGIRSYDIGNRTPLLAATIFGCAVGVASAVILAAIAIVMMLALPMPSRFVILTWIAVAVFASYVAGMSTLGGLYRLIKMQSTVVPATETD